MARVAALLEGWAGALGLDREERTRWLAAAWLHDALRNADPEALRPRVPPPAAALPGPLLHGPAAAERLRIDGVDDGELLRAVAYHTLGHPGLAALGRALYAADFLEPGRDLLNDWRAGLRDRCPGDLPGVVKEILGARIVHLVGRGSPLRAETVAFWNAMAVGG
jgi:2-amino-4-hydroxy-6-hydroxymethyldihydropteridine diphosphokinase